jgi:hypothetical protein
MLMTAGYGRRRRAARIPRVHAPGARSDVLDILAADTEIFLAGQHLAARPQPVAGP